LANAVAGLLVALCSVLLGPSIAPVDLIVLGLLQWLAIRNRGVSAWWIIASAVGAFIGLILGFPLFGFIEQKTGGIAAVMNLSDSFVVLPPLAATFAVGGAVMGLAQLRVRRSTRSTPRRWVFASMLGFAAYAVIALFLGATAYELLIPFGASDLRLESSQLRVYEERSTTALFMRRCQAPERGAVGRGGGVRSVDRG
jgi:hypothetical protein